MLNPIKAMNFIVLIQKKMKKMKILKIVLMTAIFMAPHFHIRTASTSVCERDDERQRHAGFCNGHDLQ